MLEVNSYWNSIYALAPIIQNAFNVQIQFDCMY